MSQTKKNDNLKVTSVIQILVNEILTDGVNQK